ncbi:hypothetical protein [Arthrobacter sp. JSM 101049]|uniref:hypothetical protein n=1 Tax=Arthrobacter sp. JSM 101049 TaxID=929097 RepID=UPI003563CF66
MDSQARNEIYGDTTRMNIHDPVRELNENVGTTVVQTMAGVRTRTSPHRWAKPDGPQPGAEVEGRLRLGYRAWRTLEMAEGRDVALAWLLGSNPRLDEDLPVIVSQQQRTREALGAAEAFVNDIHAV